MNNSSFKNSQVTESPARRRLFLSGFLANISMAWKMGLMVFALFLGILGITVTAYLGLQSLRYQLSNIYDFMLVPIVALSHADTAFANTEIGLQNINDLIHHGDTNSAEIEKIKQEIEVGEASAYETIAQYATEWVTTVSPEFTQQLRDAGRLDLQEQEVVALEHLNAAVDEYEILQDEYYASIEAGSADETLESAVAEKLGVAREHLQELIAINDQFAEISNQQAQAAYRQAVLNGSIALGIGLALGLIMSYLIVVSITSRLGDLTRSATAMQEGNMDQAVAVSGRDEVGLLGAAFNRMATQLKELFTSLEQRVAARTRDLAIVAEVGTATATILESKKLLQEVVDLTKERFNLYHSHIYLLDEKGENLVLTSGAGEPGRVMVAEGRSIPLDREQSLVARAARERKGVIVNDVMQAPDFLPNPLLPDTHSELAVPMIVGGTVVGVFDIQSEQVGRFTESDINIQTTLAAQLATSIQNVRSFEKSKKQAEFESLVNTIGQKIQRTTSIEETLQTAIRELGTAVSASSVRATIGAVRTNGGNHAGQNQPVQSVEE